MRLIIFIILGAASIVQAERMVQTYNGLLMKITCATATPSFLINGIYSSRHYNLLPGLFSIEARVAPDRNNVTLHVSGSILAHNVTVKCQNLVDPVTGQTETMFQLTLLFNDTIPAPHDVQYDEKNGILSRRPPQLEEVVTDDSINVVLRITHYIIHVTDLQSEFSTSFTTTGPETSIAIADVMPSMPCSVSLQVSAVNPEREGQRSTSIIADRSAVYPSSETVVTGSEALFRCQHQSVMADIAWRVNGSSIRLFTARGSVIENGSLVDTLTIPARSEYNGTEVLCWATVGDDVETTPPVTLTVVEGEEVSATATCVEITTIGMPTETTRMMTVENPTTITDHTGATTMAPMTTVSAVIDFIVLDSGISAAVFRCCHQSTDIIGWRVNGTQYNIGRFPDITTAPINEEGVQVNTLTIPARSKYNKMEVVCEAFFGTRPSEKTLLVTLIHMSEPLQNVTNLIRENSTISWEPPFSLDLTGVGPDIVYCVVYNITCGRRDLVISDCNVIEPSYTSDDIAPDGCIYEYTVTPRSNVEGGRNGTNLNIEEQFMKVISMGHTVSMMNNSNRGVSGGNDNYTRVGIHLDVHQEAIRSASYSVSLKSLDGIQMHVNYSDAVVSRNEISSVTLEVAPLPFRRIWNTTVFVHDCDDHPLTEELELSIHDLHNISITSSVPGVVMVTGDIIPGSSSIGILIIIYSLTNNSIVHYRFVKYTDMQHPMVHPTVVGLPEDKYKVIVFIMEENSRPFSRAAATPGIVQINGPVEAQPLPIEYDLQSSSTGTCVNCTFLDSSTTDCVAVVHQRISQLSSSGLMDTDSSHKFNRSGDTVYGCIEGVNMTEYQVGVVGGQQITAPLKTFVGILLAVPAMILMIIAVFTVRRQLKKDTVNQHAVPIEHLRIKLEDVASKWWSLVQSLDDEQLDETNSETDEARLRDMQECRMMREEIQAAIKKIQKM